MTRLLATLVLALFSSAMAQVTVGVNLELSGRLAGIGIPTLQGIEAALAQLEADPSGARIRTSITLSICDNATTVEGSIGCAHRFVDEGVVAVLGAISTSMSIPAAGVLQDAGIVMISTSSTNPATTQIGDYIFRVAYTDDFQGKVAARYAFNDLGASNAIVFRLPDDDYSFGLSGFFVEAFAALGGESVVVDYVANTTDFNAQINDVLGVDADIIYFSGVCAEGAELVPQLREAGLDTQLLGADGSDDSQCPDAGGEAFNGYLFTSFGGAEILSGEAAQRAQDFRSFFNMAFPDAADFNGFTLAGADSLNVIAEAVDLAGDMASVADKDRTRRVRDQLAALVGFPGVSGEITYAGTDGTPSDRTIGFFEYVVPADNERGWDKIAKFGIGTGE